MEESNGNGRGLATGQPVFWLLVEFTKRHKNTGPRYEVMSSDELRASAENASAVDLNSIHSGKTVYVQRGNSMVSVVIKTISDEKQVVLGELAEATKPKKYDNKPKRTADGAESPNTSFNHIFETNGALTGPINCRMNGSLNGSQRGASRNSQRRSPMRAVNTPSVIRSNPNIQNYRPMTFDQQTQTDFKGLSMNLNDIIGHYDEMMRSQRSMGAIQEQMSGLVDEMAEMRSLLKGLRDRFNEPSDARTSVILNSTAVPVQPSQPPRILNFSQQSHSPRVHYNSMTIEPVMETSRDSNYSYRSRASLDASSQILFQTAAAQQNGATNVSSEQADTTEEKYFDLNSTGHSSVGPSGAGPSNEYHPDDVGDPDAEVVLGNNNTTVRRSVIMSINWKAYTSATRKLLLAKFSKKTLATHSLTGKPSPGKSTQDKLK